MQEYDDYLSRRLPEVEFDPEQEAAALARVPNVPIGEGRGRRAFLSPGEAAVLTRDRRTHK